MDTTKSQQMNTKLQQKAEHRVMREVTKTATQSAEQVASLRTHVRVLERIAHCCYKSNVLSEKLNYGGVQFESKHTQRS